MIKILSQRIRQLYNSNQLPWIIICVGISLRLIRYLYNPSFWFDESDIAIDFISRPFADIINPSTDYTQAYPYAFLILMKFFAHVFGNSEYALRLFPLLSGIFSLIIFYKVAERFVERNAVLIALGLFAILNPLIFQSSNLKPYSSDILCALFIYASAIYLHSKELNMRHIIFFGIAGAVIVWLSNPSVLVMAGTGLCIIIFSMTKKEWSKIWKLTIIFSIWLTSFIANYFIYLQKLKTSFGMNMEMMLRRENAYMPIPPKSVSDIKWFIEIFFDIFNYPAGIALTGIAALAFIIGCVSMYSRKKNSFFLIISPIILTLLAGALHQYPFRDRFILFLLPAILLLVAEGAEHIRSSTREGSRIIGILFIVFLFFQPLATATSRIKQPLHHENIRPALQYVKDNWQKGDILYVHYYAQYPFQYYSEFHPRPYNFQKDEYIIGIAPRGWYRFFRKQDVSNYYGPEVSIKQSGREIFEVYRKDLDQLKGHKRAWVLFTAVIPKDGISEEKYFTYHIDSIGNKIDFSGRYGKGMVYLYDLSNKSLPVNH